MKLEEKREKNWTDGANNYSNIVNEELNSPLRNAWLEIIKQNIDCSKKLDILDVGTGPGFFTILLAQEGHNVIGIDCTEEMLKYARINAENEGVKAEFLFSDAHDTNFDDQSFDLIISRNVAWTLLDADKAYREWKRLLRPEGILIIFDANWNYRYFSSEYMQRYKKDEEEFERLFKKKPFQFTQAQIEYRKSMPMCSRIRPQWDFGALIDAGFNKIYCDRDISGKVWDYERQVLYKSTPMFMIKAEV